MIRSNKTVNEGIRFGLLSHDQMQDIHHSVLDILENIGMNVQSKKAITILQQAGARVEGSLVKLPSYLVENCLVSVPSRIVLWDRQGKQKINLSGYNSYFGPGSSNVYISDPYTGERRIPTSTDTINAIRVVEALPNIDFAADFGTISDAPAETNDLHLLKIMMNHTHKPILHWAKNLKNQQAMTEMVAAVSGSLDAFIERPSVCWFTTAVSPLIQTEDALECLMYCAENMIPNCHVSAPISGGTAPVTGAGTVALSLAETMFGVVLSQLVRKGAPCFMGCVDGPIDMKTMIMSYGNPEFQLMNAAFAEMGHYYHIPTWGASGCTDSKIVDQQAAIEAAFSVITQSFVGANLINDNGYLEGGTLASLEQLAMCDEIIGYARRMLMGLTVTDESLATDVIGQAGPRGNYFDKDHTFKHFRELWRPTLLDRNKFEVWVEDGKTTMGERLNAKVKYLIENHRQQTILSDEINLQLSKIIAAAEL